MSSLRTGHANLLCIIPILTDDPRRESDIDASLRLQGGASALRAEPEALFFSPRARRSPRPSFQRKMHSATGTRTRVARVRAEYPNQLDYSGFCTSPMQRASVCARRTTSPHDLPGKKKALWARALAVEKKSARCDARGGTPLDPGSPAPPPPFTHQGGCPPLHPAARSLRSGREHLLSSFFWKQARARAPRPGGGGRGKREKGKEGGGGQSHRHAQEKAKWKLIPACSHG